MNNQEKAQALAKYLDISKNEIKYTDKYTFCTEFYTEDGTYYVMTEEEADEAHYNYIEELIDDIGLDAFTPSFRDWIYINALDDEWFEDAFDEMDESYCRDIIEESDSTYENRFIQESIEHKLITEDDLNDDGEYEGDIDVLIEDFVEDMKKDRMDYYGSFAEAYYDELGKDNMTYCIKENPHLLDIQAISDECIFLDGYGHNLSSWDGETIELDDKLYAFKQDDYDRRDEVE